MNIKILSKTICHEKYSNGVTLKEAFKLYYNHKLPRMFLWAIVVYGIESAKDDPTRSVEDCIALGLIKAYGLKLKDDTEIMLKQRKQQFGPRR